MIKLPSKSHALLLFILLISGIAVAQNKNAFPEFARYDKWGFRAAGALYFKGSVDPQFGPNTIETYAMPGYGIGFVRILNPEDRISYKVGIYVDKTPIYNIGVKIAAQDIYPQYNGADDKEKMLSRFVATVPLLVQYKKKIDSSFYFNLEAGLHVVLMKQGEASSFKSYSNSDDTETRDVFSFYAANDNNYVYPNLVISPGFYFMFDKMLLQANIIYQKSLINYYDGEYAFTNLLVSGNSGGTYKMSGDYIGLSLTIHTLKKQFQAERRTRESMREAR